MVKRKGKRGSSTRLRKPRRAAAPELSTDTRIRVPPEIPSRPRSRPFSAPEETVVEASPPDVAAAESVGKPAKRPRDRPAVAVRRPLPRRQEELAPPAARPSRRRPRRRWRGLPWTLYRYIAAEVMRILFVSVFAISLVASVVLAFQLVRSGIRLGFLWPVLFKSLAYPLFFSIPVSLLFGITLGIGRLTGELEINAMRASGLSYAQLSWPVAVVGAGMTALCLYLNGEVIPEIHYEKGNLRDAILAQLEDLGSGQNRSLLLPSGGRLFVESYRGTRLKGVHLELDEGLSRKLSRDLRKRFARTSARNLPSTRPTLLAKACDLEISNDRTRILLNLRGVTAHIPQLVTSAQRQPDVFRQTYTIDNLKLALPFLPRGAKVKDRSWKDLFRHHRELRNEIDAADAELREAERDLPALMAATESSGGGKAPSGAPEESASEREEKLRARIAEIKNLRRELASLKKKRYDTETEVHRRGAFSLACLSFPAIGIPIVLLTGSRSRLVPFFIGNVFVVLPFFLLVMLGVMLGERGLSPMLSLVAPNLFVLAGAAYLWSRVIRR